MFHGFILFYLYLSRIGSEAPGSTSSAPRGFHVRMPLPREERRVKLRISSVSTLSFYVFVLIIASASIFVFVHFHLLPGPLPGKIVIDTQPPANSTSCPSHIIAANADIVGIGVSPYVFWLGRLKLLALTTNLARLALIFTQLYCYFP